jgi:hypothetical protein
MMKLRISVTILDDGREIAHALLTRPMIDEDGKEINDPVIRMSKIFDAAWQIIVEDTKNP